MRIRLNRISNLFRREFQVTCAIMGAIFFLLPAILLLAMGGAYPLFFLLLVGFNLVWFLTLLFSFPASFQISGGVLSFSEHYEVTKGDRKKIFFTVTSIREVEYLQNRLEKKLNIGRIRFRGDAELEPSYHFSERQMMFFQLCGIPKFSEFPALLEREMKLAPAAKVQEEPASEIFH